MSEKENNTVFCPLFGKEIAEGYCWGLCNIATDDILLTGDFVDDWQKAQRVCDACQQYKDD